MESSPIKLMKPKRTFLLLLIGAAVILTVIWSTRNVSKPTFLSVSQDQLQQKITDGGKNYLVKSRNVASAQLAFSKVLNNGSYGDHLYVRDQGSSNSNQQCSIIPNDKPDIDTSDIYPKLNFNVSKMYQTLIMLT